MKEKLKNKKFRALIELIFWIIFITGVIVFIRVETKKLDEYEASYKQKYDFVVDFDYVKNSLLNSDFDYLYIIVDDGILSFKGNRIDSLYNGVYSHDNEKKEYTNQKDVDNNYEYLDMNKIFSLFNNDFTKGKNTFVYKNDDIYVKIKVSIDNIIDIEIKDNNITYQLEFSNIADFNVKGE